MFTLFTHLSNTYKLYLCRKSKWVNKLVTKKCLHPNIKHWKEIICFVSSFNYKFYRKYKPFFIPKTLLIVMISIFKEHCANLGKEVTESRSSKHQHILLAIFCQQVRQSSKIKSLISLNTPRSDLNWETRKGTKKTPKGGKMTSIKNQEASMCRDRWLVNLNALV